MGKVAEVEDRIQEMQKQSNIEIIKKDSLWITYFLKGFTLNIFNPFVWHFGLLRLLRPTADMREYAIV